MCAQCDGQESEQRIHLSHLDRLSQVRTRETKMKFDLVQEYTQINLIKDESYTNYRTTAVTTGLIYSIQINKWGPAELQENVKPR